jgi:hypothetical protein
MAASAAISHVLEFTIDEPSCILRTETSTRKAQRERKKSGGRPALR